MKASISKNYGTPEVFNYGEVVTPVPNRNEVLVKIHVSTVTGSDLMMRRGKPYIGRLFLGLTKPKTTILGFDFAGEIYGLGEHVTAFKVGDRVFGGTTALGTYAEYACIHIDDVISILPPNMTFMEAAPVAGSAITVMNFLKGLANIKTGNRVLINGASGSLGTYAVQIAKTYGAEVTVVCISANLKMVKELGADFVIDYTTSDFTQNNKRYDIIFDTVGNRTFSDCKKSLTDSGVFLSTVINFRLMLDILKTSFMFSKKRAKSSSTGMLHAKRRLAYLLELKQLMERRKIKTIIDQTYTLDQMIKAHQHAESGPKKGNIIITIPPDQITVLK